MGATIGHRRWPHMTRTSGGLIHGYSGTIWTVAVLWSRDSYTRVYRGISLWIVHLAKRHVAHPPLQIKEPRPQRGSSLRLSTVRDHGGAGQLDPRTVITQYTTLACRHKNKLCVIGPQHVPSVARVAAGAFGFLTLIQVFDGSLIFVTEPVSDCNVGAQSQTDEEEH